MDTQNPNEIKISNEIRSKILIDALPYIQRYNGKIVVVKYGGNAMTCLLYNISEPTRPST